jgi:cellulose 1,4-beta-cellobiosidase
MKAPLISIAALALLSSVSADQYPKYGGDASIPSGTNPYAGVGWYVDEDYTRRVNGSISTFNSQGKTNLARLANYAANTPTFIWLPNTVSIDSKVDYVLADSRKMNAIRVDGRPGPISVGFFIYNLPDRDCGSGAAAGEITGKPLDTMLAEYQVFIGKVRAKFMQYPDIRIVAILEPDAIPYLVTHTADPNSKCSKAKANYIAGIRYAIQNLQFPHVALYLDVGHGLWLNTTEKQQSAANIMSTIMNGLPKNYIRGISTNKGNYNPVKIPNVYSAWDDSLGFRKTNPGYDAYNYATTLGQKLSALNINNYALIDTSRSGVYPIPGVTDQWCNLKDAGIGIRPTEFTQLQNIDAFVWSAPGESDGTSDSSQPRYDSVCNSAVALKPAPQEGQWFHALFEKLVTNAKPALDQS